MSSKISQFFNPSEHLVFHQDKDGNMMGGGYRVNNLLYEHKMPLFVSLDGGNGAKQTGGGSDHAAHFIPEKFSDLFRDLAVPAGLFMMPPMFRPRNYEFEVPEESEDAEDAEENTDKDDRDHYKTTKHAPDDIFDTLLSLVESKERIQHDVKTRRRRQTGAGAEAGVGANASEKNNTKNKKQTTTKRRRMK